MERFLQPEKFDVDPNDRCASQKFTHWFRMFETFLKSLQAHSPDKLDMLIHYLSHSVFQIIADCNDYGTAVAVLTKAYVKPRNEIFARYALAICKQESGQDLTEFDQKLKLLLKDCNFKARSADECRDDALRDAFITGLQSNAIRQRLLEHKTLDYQSAFDMAISLEMAEKHSQFYVTPSACAASSNSQDIRQSPDTPSYDNPVSASANTKCFFCGYSRHPRSKCPARDALCKNCDKKGHFQKVCQSKSVVRTTAFTHNSLLSSLTLAAAPGCLSRAIVKIHVNGIPLQALIDTGSSDSYICSSVTNSHKWKTITSRNKIAMANILFKPY